MSWHFSQALVAEYLAANCSDGAPFALLKSSHTPPAYCAPDRMKAFSRLSRFGMTFAPLTADLGEAVLMWFLEAFPARTYPPREMVQESTESAAGYGLSLPASLAKYDRGGHSWKTRQLLLTEDLGESLEIWPTWGIALHGVCWELNNLAPSIEGGEFGFWPTPTKMDHKGATTGCKKYHETRGGGYLRYFVLKLAGGPQRTHYPVPLLHEMMMGWPEHWTALNAPATDKFQSWLQQHGGSSGASERKAI